jgi:hypothetical protein
MDLFDFGVEDIAVNMSSASVIVQDSNVTVGLDLFAFDFASQPNPDVEIN